MKNSNLNEKHHLSFYRVIALTISFGLLFALSSCYNSSKKSNNANTTASKFSQVTPVSQKITSLKVIINDSSYVPQALAISKGDTVTWVNKDSIAHTVTSGTPGNPSTLFNSKDIAPDSTFSFVFDSTGSFAYYCIHKPKQMNGTITVK